MRDLDIGEVARRSKLPASTPARRHMQCPTFRRLLRAAAAGAFRGARRR
jgi:hypothetical protein